MPNDLQRRSAVSTLKITIPSKNMREEPANTPIIHSVYELCIYMDEILNWGFCFLNRVFPYYMRENQQIPQLSIQFINYVW
jgi:hypothetical protein